MNDCRPAVSPRRLAWRRFAGDRLAVAGAVMIALLLAVTTFAPFIANGRPLLMFNRLTGEWSMPFLRFIFAPEGSETIIESFFNYAMIFAPAALIVGFFLRKRKRIRTAAVILLATVTAVPFFIVRPHQDPTDYRKVASGMPQGSFVVFAPIPYGPAELAAAPYAPPDSRHIFGCDRNGRSVASRMLYGGRVSLAVGLGATLLALTIGTVLGLYCGYFGGAIDLSLMRFAEIVLCFPTFLLLLILMVLFKDWNFDQSVLIVISVIGLTGWIGVCFIVRGEVLKQREMTYIKSCVTVGLSNGRILFVHLLPNIAAPLLVTFTFSVAGAIIAESSLSFLGFGVQPPTASWGNLLRQAYENPFEYWHLTLIPGAALFISICAFNFSGEGLRRFFDP
ncbi:MAG: ABC transporter permease [Victivallaceae bacterium]|nr:ABC transporter permease [Victivallaceae bacterium]